MAYCFLMQKPNSQATSDTQRHLVRRSDKKALKSVERRDFHERQSNCRSEPFFPAIFTRVSCSTQIQYPGVLENRTERKSRALLLYSPYAIAQVDSKDKLRRITLFFYINCLLAALNKIKALGV